MPRESSARPGESRAVRLALRAACFLVPVALALVYLRAGLHRQGRLGFPMDDPYIHFQFARNLAAGKGFAFNPGEPTPGATSPLWVLLLAGARLLGAPIEAAAIALGVLCAGLAGWLTLEVALAAGLGISAATLAALAAAAAGRMTWASLSGMEVCLATALSLALAWRWLRRPCGASGWVLTGIGAGLCVLARPEMALLVALLAALSGTRAPKAVSARAAAGAAPAALRPLALPLRLAALLLPAAALVAPYVAFSLATTGRPLPNTYYAKSFLPLHEAGAAMSGLRGAYVKEMLDWLWRDNPFTLALLLPGATTWLWRRRPPAVLLWPVLFWAYSLAIFPRHFNASRYTIPLIPFLAIIAMGAFEELLLRLRMRTARLAAPALAGVVLAVGSFRGHLDTYPLYLANIDTVLHLQVAMGEWVRENLPGDARVATHDVGAITYYGGRYCIDTVGLVSGDLVGFLLRWNREHGSVDFDAALAEYLPRARADVGIFFPEWYPRLTRQPWLRPAYRIDRANSTGGGNSLVVYRVERPPGGQDAHRAP